MTTLIHQQTVDKANRRIRMAAVVAKYLPLFYAIFSAVVSITAYFLSR